MKEIIYRRATVYIRQEIQYQTEEERDEKIADIEGQASLDLSNIQDGGCSEYEYRFDGFDEAREDFPHWMFED